VSWWGSSGETTEGDFTARAGALTLLFVSGSMDREDLLELLHDAQLGGLLGPSGGVLPTDEEIAAENERWEEPDDPPEGSGPAIRPRSGLIGPHTQLRTSSKGEEFLFVAFAIERWLRNCPEGPLELGLRGARALAPLVCCWSATVTHALAPEPLTLAELDRAVSVLDADVVAEHVEAMERSGQVRELPGGGETRYALTDWGREAIAPIIAAVRYECRYPEDDVLPPDVFDAEAAFQMALPLLRLAPHLRGSCRLGVEVPGEEPLMAGATVQVERGCVLSSSALLDESPETWVTGSPLDWCETVIDPSTEQLECGGDTELAAALLEALYEALFGLGRGLEVSPRSG
jgi:DNA-binding HxlR family transcriptional regulator